MNKNLIISLLLIANFTHSCKNQTDKNSGSPSSPESELISDDIAEVKIMPLRYTSFSKEIISNGKLTALQKADLKFRSSETVATVLVQNGERVTKGQVIARLDQFTLNNTLKQTKGQYDRAYLELQDLLIGMGYNLRDSARIPREAYKAAIIKSGFDKARYDLEMAEYNLQVSELRSPINGIVANLFSKENNQSNVGDKFCTVIDDSKFEAEFPVLENELASVKKGQSVRIVPFAFPDLTVTGQITQVNPVVDQNGMVKVKAVCTNPGNKLTEGMNVKIIAEDKVPHQLVIPKQALVLRSEKQVVFTLEKGIAKWIYVTTGLENSTSYTVVDGLKQCDTVIYEGNLNLAHDAKVEVVGE